MSATTGPFLDLSCVIITLNEERRLLACLGSLPKGAEVIVLDSGSTDRTCEIARQAGARVEQRIFTNHADQKNAVMALATRRWVFSVDADEVLDPILVQSVERTVLQGSESIQCYRVTRRLWFMGRRMRFGKTVDHPLRLVLAGSASFTHAIHECLVMVDSAQVGRLTGELAHYSYDNVTDYFTRFNNYTSKIAENHMLNRRSMPSGPVHWLRPWSEFFTRYFLRLGFLDGYPGYCYALFSSLYTFVKYVKLRERLNA